MTPNSISFLLYRRHLHFRWPPPTNISSPTKLKTQIHVTVAETCWKAENNGGIYQNTLPSRLNYSGDTFILPPSMKLSSPINWTAPPMTHLSHISFDGLIIHNLETSKSQDLRCFLLLFYLFRLVCYQSNMLSCIVGLIRYLGRLCHGNRPMANLGSSCAARSEGGVCDSLSLFFNSDLKQTDADGNDKKWRGGYDGGRLREMATSRSGERRGADTVDLAVFRLFWRCNDGSDGSITVVPTATL